MKKLLLYFVLLSNLVLSQNYNPIIPARDAWFEYRVTTELRTQPIRIDSVKNNAGDITYYNYKLFDYTNSTGSCISQTDTNFFINRMLAKTNGNCYFYNKNIDTIVINQFATVGTSWGVYRYSNGNYIEATVDSVIKLSVLGSNDSVKFISLQAKNVSNNPIADNFNGKQILLGKTSGLIRFYQTYGFPADTTSFNLVGKSSPVVGTINLTNAQIYDWNVGDVFQYSGGYNQAPSSANSVKEQYTVLSKTVSANNDTITYTRSRIHCEVDYHFNPLDSTYYNFQDTVTQKVIISEKAPLDYYPYESIYNVNGTYGYLFQFWDNNYFGRMRKELNSGFVYSSSSNCVVIPTGWCVFPIATYAKGIGLVSEDDGGTSCFKNNIVYYNKGTEVWGSPVTMCSLNGIDSRAVSNIVSVYPNPSNGIFKIRSGNVNIETIEICNVIGEKIFSKNRLQKNEETVDLSAQPQGIYYVSINAGGKLFTQKIIVK